MLLALRLRCRGLGREGRIFKIRTLHVAVKEHHPRQVDRAIAAEDLVLVQFEVDAQALDDVGMGAGFDFQADCVSLAPVVQLHADGLQQGARFFLFEIEVGVAGDAEWRH